MCVCLSLCLFTTLLARGPMKIMPPATNQAHDFLEHIPIQNAYNKTS